MNIFVHIANMSLLIVSTRLLCQKATDELTLEIRTHFHWQMKPNEPNRPTNIYTYERAMLMTAS